VPKLKAPKIPFLGKKDTEPDIDDEESSAPGISSDLDYLEPTSFQKKLPVIAVIAGWGITIATIGGIAGYVIISEDAILQSMVDARPVTEVNEIVIVHDDTLQETGVDNDSNADTDHDSATEGSLPDSDGARTDAYAGLLQPHPDPGLIENNPVGPLPITGSDGRMPWRVYSRPSNPIETRPRISIIITGLGINKKSTEAALKMSGDISLAFVPYAHGLADWINKARELGHETLLTLPMEPSNFPKSDPGPLALMSTLDT